MCGVGSCTWNSYAKGIEELEFIPQMDASGATDFERDLTVDSKAFTTFMEAAPTEEGTSTRSTHSVSTYDESYTTVKDFLLRPVNLATGAWTTSQVLNTNLVTINIASLLSSVTMWADKIRGFNLIRGDFMFKVQLNASPFHQGKLILHWLPCYQNFVSINPKYASFKNKILTQKVQHPHVELDVRKTAVTVRIPYVAPTAWYGLKETTFDWGTIFLDIFSGLQIGAAAPASELYVDYACFGWFENIELNAPTVAQSNTKSRRRGGEEETKEAMGPIELGLRKATKVSNILTEVPLLGDVAGPVAWASNILANVASVLGWSKPRENDGTTIVAEQYFRYGGTTDGPDLAFPGGFSCLNRLETIDYGSFTREDEMSMAYLMGIPYYYGEFTWGNTAGQGASLLSFKVAPLAGLLSGSDVVGLSTVNYVYHCPFTYLANVHKLWRGNMKLTLKFIKTQMHSGRVQVTWIPAMANTYTAPSLTTSSFNKRAIIDIRTDEIVSLDLPYLINRDYLPTDTSSGEFPYSGQFDIVVLNDLRAPESCAQNVKVQWFISPGDDFELAGPGIPSFCGCVPYMPQSNGASLIRSSVDQGMEIPGGEIGGSNTHSDPLFHAKRCIGEKILSVKQLINRNSVLLASKIGDMRNWSVTPQFMIDPWYIGGAIIQPGGGIRSSGFLGDIYSYLAPMYAFHRGGARLSVIDGFNPARRMYTNVITYTTQPSTQPTDATAGYVGNLYAATLDIGPNLSSGNYAPLSSCNFNEVGNFVFQHVPYYNNFPFALNTVYTGIDDLSADSSREFTKVIVGCADGLNFSATPIVQRSMADDFQLMYFTGCPPLVTSHSVSVHDEEFSPNYEHINCDHCCALEKGVSQGNSVATIKTNSCANQ